MLNLLDIVHPQAVKVPLDATDKEGAIDELIAALDEAGVITDAKKLKAVVWEREMQRSTGIGEGLAIPHGKCDVSDELVMAMGRPQTPIDFGAIDGKPVQLVILLASPPSKTSDHIQALGKISRLMHDADFRARAYAAESSEALYDLFASAVTAGK